MISAKYKEQTVIATSIRIPEKRNDYIKKKAAETGLSQHAFMLLLIDLGIKLYESDIIHLPKAE